MSEQANKHSSRQVLIRAAKWLIALAVVVGLFFAVKSAIAQWDQQKVTVREAIADLDREINSASDDELRGKLEAKKARLQSNLPTFQNLGWARIALASFIYAVALIPPGFVLSAAVRSLGEHPRLSTAIAAQLLGHAGKYGAGESYGHCLACRRAEC